MAARTRPQHPAESATPMFLPQGKHLGKQAMTLNRPFTLIGSRTRAHLHLLSDTVSKSHAAVINTGRGVYVRDLASRTHVLVNGREVREVELSDADLVTVGAFSFQFADGSAIRPGRAPALPPAALEVAGSVEPLRLEGRTTIIGRRPTCDVALLEPTASIVHAIIFEAGGNRFVRDLGSRTGTLVNGAAVHHQELKFGDVIRVGETTFRYVPAEAADADGLEELEDLVGTARLGAEPEPPPAPVRAPAAATSGSNGQPAAATIKPPPVPTAPADADLIPLAGDDDLDLIPLAEAPAPRPAAPAAPPPAVAVPEIDLDNEPDLSGSGDTLHLPPAAKSTTKPPPTLSPRITDEPGEVAPPAAMRPPAPPVGLPPAAERPTAPLAPAAYALPGLRPEPGDAIPASPPVAEIRPTAHHAGPVAAGEPGAAQHAAPADADFGLEFVPEPPAGTVTPSAAEPAPVPVGFAEPVEAHEPPDDVEADLLNWEVVEAAGEGSSTAAGLLPAHEPNTPTDSTSAAAPLTAADDVFDALVDQMARDDAPHAPELPLAIPAVAPAVTEPPPAAADESLDFKIQDPVPLQAELPPAELVEALPPATVAAAPVPTEPPAELPEDFFDEWEEPRANATPAADVAPPPPAAPQVDRPAAVVPPADVSAPADDAPPTPVRPPPLPLWATAAGAPPAEASGLSPGRERALPAMPPIQPPLPRPAVSDDAPLAVAADDHPLIPSADEFADAPSPAALEDLLPAESREAVAPHEEMNLPGVEPAAADDFWDTAGETGQLDVAAGPTADLTPVEPTVTDVGEREVIATMAAPSSPETSQFTLAGSAEVPPPPAFDSEPVPPPAEPAGMPTAAEAPPAPPVPARPAAVYDPFFGMSRDSASFIGGLPLSLPPPQAPVPQRRPPMPMPRPQPTAMPFGQVPVTFDAPRQVEAEPLLGVAQIVRDPAPPPTDLPVAAPPATAEVADPAAAFAGSSSGEVPGAAGDLTAGEPDFGAPADGPPLLTGELPSPPQIFDRFEQAGESEPSLAEADHLPPEPVAESATDATEADADEILDIDDLLVEEDPAPVGGGEGREAGVPDLFADPGSAEAADAADHVEPLAADPQEPEDLFDPPDAGVPSPDVGRAEAARSPARAGTTPDDDIDLFPPDDMADELDLSDLEPAPAARPSGPLPAAQVAGVAGAADPAAAAAALAAVAAAVGTAPGAAVSPNTRPAAPPPPARARRPQTGPRDVPASDLPDAFAAPAFPAGDVFGGPANFGPGGGIAEIPDMTDDEPAAPAPAPRARPAGPRSLPPAGKAAATPPAFGAAVTAAAPAAGPSRVAIPTAVPPAKPSRKRLRVVLLLLLLAAAAAAVVFGVWYLRPKYTSVGVLRFRGLENWSAAERGTFHREQIDLLAKMETRAAARRKLPAGAAGGFLGDGMEAVGDFGLVARGSKWNARGDALTLEHRSGDPAGDRQRLKAVLAALYESSRAAAATDRDRGQLQTDLADAAGEMNKAGRDQAALGAKAELARKLAAREGEFRRQAEGLKRQVDELSRRLGAAHVTADIREQELKGLQNDDAPLAGAVAIARADPAAGGGADDLDLKRLVAEAEALTERLVDVKSDRDAQATAAKAAFDAAQAEFERQLNAAKEAVGNDATLAAYIAQFQAIRETIRQLNNEIVEQQRESRDALDGMKTLLLDQAVTRQKQAWDADPKLKELRELIDATTHQYNTAVNNRLAAQAAEKKARLAALEKEVSDRRAQLATADAGQPQMKELETAIDKQLKKLDQTRENNEARLQKLFNTTAAAPNMDKLSAGQRAMTQKIEESKVALSKARADYNARVDKVNASSDGLMKVLGAQAAAQQEKVEQRRSVLAVTAETVNRLKAEARETRTASLRQRRDNLALARKARDEAQAAYDAGYKQYRAAEDEVGKAFAAADEVRQADAAKAAAGRQYAAAEARVTELTRQIRAVVQPDPPDDASVTTQPPDPPEELRWQYLAGVSGGTLLLTFLTLAITRTPVPPARAYVPVPAGDENVPEVEDAAAEENAEGVEPAPPPQSRPRRRQGAKQPGETVAA